MTVTWRFFSERFQRYFDDTLELESHLAANPEDRIFEVAVDTTHSGVVAQIPTFTELYVRDEETGDVVPVSVSGGELTFSGSNALPESEIFDVKYRIGYWAERNSSVGSNTTFAFGNGASNDQGILIGQNGTIVYFAVTSEGSAAASQIALDVNSSQAATLDWSGNGGSTTLSVNVNAGDRIIPRTNFTGAGYSVVVAYWEVEYTAFTQEILRGPKGDRGEPGVNGGPVPNGGVSGQVLTKISEIDGDAIWQTFSQGGQYCQLVNNSQTNLNASSAGTAVSFNDSSGFINPFPANYNISSAGVEVLVDGDYYVDASMYFTSTVQRPNVGLRFTLDGVDQGIIGAGGYIRSQAGHNEASTSVSQIISATSGTVIGVEGVQLAAGGTVTSPAGTGKLIVRKL